MEIDERECIHISQVLEKTKLALLQKNALVLKNLSNQTIHSSCNYQDSGSITITILLYALSKIIERNDYEKVKNWDSFIKKFNSILNLAILALEQNNQGAYRSHIQRARKTLESQSINLKPYIQDVLRKASINKGSKIYEHGVSLEQTSKLLGVSQWELLEYIGQKASELSQNRTIDVKTRAKMAMDFFE